MIRFRASLMLALLLVAVSAVRAEETRLLRFPAIHGGKIVFSYAGDLFSVSASGGVARRLTSDKGYEMFARFSPDGKAIAFTGQYDGNTEVYLMPAEGGTPRRLTFTATLGRDDVSDRMGPNNIVMAWRNNDTIVYRSRMHEANDFKGMLFAVPREGGTSIQLPLPRAGFCSFSADGTTMAYNRIFREFRTWKRYRGGQADDVWLYDFASRTTTNLTNNPAQDIIPMLRGNTVYFVSDREETGRMNLYSIDIGTKQTRKLTNFSEYDVKFPSLGDSAIVFENGGYIHVLDLATETVRRVAVAIQEDFAIGRGGLRDVSKEITNFEIAPDGSRALFGARGDLFTVPAKHGNVRNLTATPGVHERGSKWSPDGKWIACVSDASGEDELYLVPQDGRGKPVRLTNGGDAYKYRPLWSPDSKKLLWSDRKQRLQYVDIDSKNVTLAAQATAFEITDYAWSPDSRWIAYAMPEELRMTTIQLYSLDSKKTVEVTDGWFSSFGPAFSPDGKYLFFVSDRSFSPTYGQTEWNHVYVDMARIYLVTLAKSTPSPFAPKSDEVGVQAASDKEKEKKDAKDTKEKEETKKPEPVTVDGDGIQDRIAVIPVTPSGYDGLACVGDKLYYTRHGRKDPKTQLVLYELDKQKETELGEVAGYEISTDGKKMLVAQGESYSVIDLPTGKIDLSEKLNLSDMQVVLDRKAEWNQIFNECWRQMRDFFYDPSLHRVDWPLMRARYGALLPYVNHRADLTYIIGEMIGELNIGHAYVGGGDYPKADRVQQGLLGAKLARDASSKYYRIAEILRGQNWDENLRSPLTEIGVDVKPGDYIIAVNGESTAEMKDINEALWNTAGKQVSLAVNSSPKEAGARNVTVVPTADERDLYYYNWVQRNLEKVTKATGGRVGYVHIPDMGADGLNQFVKYYYPQIRKDALIVDVRGNGGGNVSPQIIERLRREVAMIDIARNTAYSPDPDGTIVGPKVMLLDEFSASDGDIVAYRFKKYKIGPVIGKRSWGGVVGIRGTLPLLDGGFLNKPEFSRYDVRGKEWIMEGKGVEPDIYVDNDPSKEFDGVDQQLDKAIEVVLGLLKANPPTVPPPPPYPDKSR
ncbi:MAG: PDZ domain-containing protein [Candidatus Krumholzibacteria bacterium]|nr:PDZ domain-containing protein [Candidatus Krumholzibacteria bacterium]